MCVMPGPARSNGPSLRDRLVNYARSHVGQVVGSGQCSSFVDEALKACGARQLDSFGAYGEDDDYVWGQQTSLYSTAAGDVAQFRNYRMVRRETFNSRWSEHWDERPHHTALVLSNDGNGRMTIAEQNAPEGSPVQIHQLHFTSSEFSEGSSNVRVTVSGTIWVYQPLAVQ